MSALQAPARALTRLFKTTAEMLFLGRALEKLRVERQALAAIVNAAVDRFIPADMERLFPSEESGEEPGESGAEEPVS